MKTKSYWKVEMLNAFDQWVDAEWMDDDKPMTFQSQAEAEAEIDDHIKSAKEAGMKYFREDYRAEPVPSHTIPPITP